VARGDLRLFGTRLQQKDVVPVVPLDALVRQLDHLGALVYGDQPSPRSDALLHEPEVEPGAASHVEDGLPRCRGQRLDGLAAVRLAGGGAALVLSARDR
jgi:hypothetical protein